MADAVDRLLAQWHQERPDVDVSPIGVVAGTVLANAVTERTLELSFAAVQLFFAYSLARRAMRPANG